MSNNKPVLSNSSVKSNCDAQQTWFKAHSIEANILNVKFAGEQARDRLYDSKEKKKLIRVLTVIGYIFTVSLAAIMLSLYYVFFYPKHQKARAEKIPLIVRDESVISPYDVPTTDMNYSYVTPSPKVNVLMQKLIKLMSAYNTNLNDTY